MVRLVNAGDEPGDEAASSSERRERPYDLSLDSGALAPLPAQDLMSPVLGVIAVAAWRTSAWPRG